MARGSSGGSVRSGLCRLWSLGEASTRLQGMRTALGTAMHVSASRPTSQRLCTSSAELRHRASFAVTTAMQTPQREDMHVPSLPLLCALTWSLFLCLATSPASPAAPPQVPYAWSVSTGLPPWLHTWWHGSLPCHLQQTALHKGGAPLVYSLISVPGDPVTCLYTASAQRGKQRLKEAKGS